MIYKLSYQDGRKEFCTAKNELHLLKSYDADFGILLYEIEELELISDDDAKKIMVWNIEFNEANPDLEPEKISLYELADGEDFSIIAVNYDD